MRAFVTDEARSARMSRQRSKDTAPELALRRALHARGLRYFVHRRPLPNLRRTADIVFPRQRVAAFVDGCFWHGCEAHGNMPRPNPWYWPDKILRNRERDHDTDKKLIAAGWRVIRAWEHEDVGDVANRTEKILKAPLTGGPESSFAGSTVSQSRLPAPTQRPPRRPVL